MSKMLTCEEVKQTSLKNGFDFLDNIFIGYGNKYSFKCLKHGKIFLSRFENIRKGHGLKCCLNEKLRKYCRKDVVEICNKKDYEFLSDEFKSVNNKYKIKCLKHNKIYESQIRALIRGHDLKCCIKYSGVNHSQWNPKLTDEDRKRRGCKNITKEIVKKKYNYTCQICNKQFLGKYQLNVHHIKNSSQYKELKDDINNCFLFCTKHHIMFHSIYGKKNNNLEQIERFKSYGKI